MIVVSFIVYFFGYTLGKRGAYIISILNMLVCCVCMSWQFFSIFGSKTTTITYVKVCS